MLTDRLFLFSLAVLTVVVLIVLGMVLYFAAKRSQGKPAGQQKIVRMRSDSLRSSFRAAVELIEGNVAARADRYSIPWVMVLNEGDDLRQLPIEQSGVPSALSTEAASVAGEQGIGWHFFDRGVVVDLQGAYLGSPDDEEKEQGAWDEFLGLCRTYRPQRPFDSVVLTIPAALLLDDSPDSRLELTRRAKLAHRRLWLAQNRFAMRFAVYVVITGGEVIEGFTAFAQSLPETLRASMLGWSSPYDLSTTYQPAWVDESMGSMVRSVADMSAELFALETQSRDPGQQILLPARIETMRAQLQLYADELMRPSAYHEPFFLRGIYLTGESAETAQLAAAPGTELALRDADPGGALDASADLMAQLMRQPAFLRDLFEKKIFLEYGLARPSRSQTLTRPALHRALRWTGIAVMGGWAIGLLVATVQLHQHRGSLVAALTQLQQDGQQRLRARQAGTPLPAGWYRAKAMELLAMNERLRTDATRSFFMPGSWALVDDLHERVVERIEREFAEIGVTTLRRELIGRVSQLSGMPQDESTGELVIGASCRVPPSFDAVAGAARRSGLLVEEVPEFIALQRYLTSVEQADAALQAMDRLRRPGLGNADDLRLVARFALGAELPADLDRSLRYFREAAGNGSALAIATAPLQDALRCALFMGTQQLDGALFSRNALLQSELAIARLWPVVARGNDFSRGVAAYRELLSAMESQAELAASGQGGWMRQPQLALGPVYDKTVARIEQNRLLGTEAGERVRRDAQREFQQMRTAFGQRLAGAQAGLVWQDKEGRFALSPERVALRDALNTLLNRPFMAPSRQRALPTSGGGWLNWNTARLDEALGLAAVHARFVAEDLPAFPAALQQGVRETVARHLAQQLMDQVAEAAQRDFAAAGGATGLSEAQAAAFGAVTERMARLEALLRELGAGTRAQDLRALVSNDALARIQATSDALDRSELFAMRGRDFKAWQGDRGPALLAFGVGDQAALAGYLAQQFARAEVLSKQADQYLAVLDGADAQSMPAQRWRAIGRDVERYKLKNPNSSLLLLEQFLATTGFEADRQTCLDKLAGKGGPVRADDDFAQRHAQIHAAMLARCLELQFASQQMLWAKFQDGFNRVAAGRHPFGPATQRDFQIADYQDLGELLAGFDAVAPVLLGGGAALQGNTGFALPGQAARRFVQDFGPVRTLLAPLYVTQEDAQRGYDVTVEFRSNTTAEIEGNQIIDWTLEMGDQVLRLHDAPRTLRWDYGKPIALNLRMAKDSPLVPRPDDKQSALLVEGRNVSFRFSNPWSLFTLAQSQRMAEDGQRPDSRSQLLRFEFPLAAVVPADAALVPAGGRARVFLRLSLTPAGKKTSLQWPASFPMRAPDWTQP